MVDAYTLGSMFSAIEYALPLMLICAAVLAVAVFRECRRKARDELRLRQFYRSLTAGAEVCGMVALFGIASFFGRALISHDKNVLATTRQEYAAQVRKLSRDFQNEFCSYRTPNGTPAFRENFTPECSAADLKSLQDNDMPLVEQKIGEIERLSVLTGSTKLIVALDELKSNLQELARAQLALARNHGPLAEKGQSTASVLLLALALVCALMSAALKTGKACHEWHAGRRLPGR